MSASISDRIFASIRAELVLFQVERSARFQALDQAVAEAVHGLLQDARERIRQACRRNLHRQNN